VAAAKVAAMGVEMEEEARAGARAGGMVAAAVCCWGLYPRCPGVVRCLSGVNISSSTT